MDIFELREYALSLPEVEESMPFGDDVLIFKVAGRMFMAAWLVGCDRVAVKCHPQRAELLRERYSSVTPAWHFNKRHWNDVRLDADLPSVFIRQQIAHSYLETIRCNVSPKSLKISLLQRADSEGVKD